MNEVVVKVLLKWANWVCAEVYREWDKHNVDGKAEIKFEIMENTMDLLVGQFQATGQKAWICEYGKGSAMRPPDADFKNYRASKVWNDYRNGRAVQGREAGPYEDLDGNEYWSSGQNKGKNLELFGDDKYKALPPKMIIHNVVMDHNSAFWRLMLEDLERELKHFILSVILPKGRFTVKI